VPECQKTYVALLCDISIDMNRFLCNLTQTNYIALLVYGWLRAKNSSVVFVFVACKHSCHPVSLYMYQHDVKNATQ